MNRLLAGTLWLLVSCGASQKSSNADTAIIQVGSDDRIIAEKLFSNFITIDQDPLLRKEMYNSPAGRELAAGMIRQYQSAVKNCATANCLFRNLLIN
jgi:hypothetical protein